MTLCFNILADLLVCLFPGLFGTFLAAHKRVPRFLAIADMFLTPLPGEFKNLIGTQSEVKKLEPSK